MKKSAIKVHKKATLEKKISLIQVIEEFLRKRYDFRYNEVNGKVEFKKKNDGKFVLLTDYEINTLHRKLGLKDINCSISRLRGLIHSNFSASYNPFKDYLCVLPAYDGSEDYILQLAETVKTTNDPLWYRCFRKWITALVASLMDDETVNHTVLVFAGLQGIGKTRWSLALVPRMLKDYCYSGTVNPDNKDTTIHLSECMLINLDELENLNRAEVGSLKELITKTSIRIRRPYGFSSENLVRRASFIGSVNGKEFLSDITGNRRFLSFEVTEIENNHNINMDLMYSQAKHLYLSGFRFWFDQDEIAELERNNQQFRTVSIEEELLLKYFAPCEQTEATHTLSTTELLFNLQAREGTSVSEAGKQKLGKALNAHGFRRFSKNSRYVYALREKPAGISEISLTMP